jgi:hypothetical protein
MSTKAWRQVNKEKLKSYHREWSAQNRDKVKQHWERWNLKATYGLTVEERDRLFEAQGRCCAICRKVDPGSRGWCVDHDHQTKKVRGILCMQCNTLLGQNGDNIENISKTYERQITYLKLTAEPDASKV